MGGSVGGDASGGGRLLLPLKETSLVMLALVSLLLLPRAAVPRPVVVVVGAARLAPLLLRVHSRRVCPAVCEVRRLRCGVPAEEWLAQSRRAALGRVRLCGYGPVTVPEGAWLGEERSGR